MWNSWSPDFATPGGDLATATRFPAFPARLPDTNLVSGRYRISFARTPDELDRALRLRYEVFRRELDSGLPGTDALGRDEDDLDAGMHHLLVWHEPSATVVGTYRLWTADMAAARGGLYSASEFDLAGIPDRVLASALEIGRACIAREHRKGYVLHLLWKGLASYMTWNALDYLFGCCSLTGTDPSVGWTAWAQLREAGHVDPDVRVTPAPGSECVPECRTAPVEIPILFRSYLDIGATVCGPPSIDTIFGTTDFFVMLDLDRLKPSLRRALFR